jgi:hypothetical protein
MFINNLKIPGAVKIELAAKDLLTSINRCTEEKALLSFRKMDDERSTEFIPRKEAMKMLNVSTALTMIRWEEKGYLNPHRIGGRIFYRQNEVIAAFEKFYRMEDFYA